MDVRHNNTGSVMTTEVVPAEYGTPFEEVVRRPAGGSVDCRWSTAMARSSASSPRRT